MKKKSLWIVFLVSVLLFVPIDVKADNNDCYWYQTYSDHNWSSPDYDNALDLDNNYHEYPEKCEECGLIRYEKEEHDWYEEGTYKKCDAHHHYTVYECINCGHKKYSKESHQFKYSKLIQWAEPKANGIFQYKCTDCGYTYKKKIAWNYSKVKKNVDGYASFDISSRNNIYRNTKYITVKTYSYDKGYVLKVRIGRKIYTKKMNGRTNKYRFKLKKASYGNSVDVGTYYKGRRVGKDLSNAYNKVLYAKNMKTGMTKKQLKCTYKFLNHWGNPSSTAVSSSGWSYWYYGDGSYILFKHGKVRGWYDANS